jgi:hypothetical protein
MTDSSGLTLQTKYPILGSFHLYLTWSNLPSRRRQGAAPKTIQGYAQDISIFLRWWQGTFGMELTLDAVKADPFRLNRKVLQDFLAWLQTTQGYAASTVLRYAASLRAFCQFLQNEGFIQHDPALGLRLPVKKTQEPKGLDDAQRARFEAAFQSPWVDKVTKRKRTHETQAGLTFDPGQGDCFPDAVCRTTRRRSRTVDSGGCRTAAQIRGAAYPPGQRFPGAGCPAAEAGPGTPGSLAEGTREAGDFRTRHYSWNFAPVVGDCPGARCRT